MQNLVGDRYFLHAALTQDLNVHVQCKTRYAIPGITFFLHVMCSPTVSKFQRLLVLEAEHGPLPGTTPALTDVIDYLENVCYTNTSQHSPTWLLNA